MPGIEAVVAFFLDSAESFEVDAGNRTGFGFCRVRLWSARLPFCLKATRQPFQNNASISKQRNGVGSKPNPGEPQSSC